jgi:hypothetical protein
MKTICWILLIAVSILGLRMGLFAQSKKPIEVRKITPEDSSIVEEWERVTSDRDVLGVSAARSKRAKWNWQVTVNAAEFARKAPLEARLHEGILSALKKVKGVKAVVHEDREVWALEGEASGEELVRACAVVVDELADDLRKHLKSL